LKLRTLVLRIEARLGRRNRIHKTAENVRLREGLRKSGEVMLYKVIYS